MLICYLLFFLFIISSRGQILETCNNNNNNNREMKRVVKQIKQLGPGPFDTPDPFLFCVYHKDMYPKGDDNMRVPNGGGNGMDFDPQAEFRMYHGTNGLPGFPQHPHRGFETITATLPGGGYVDHSDSIGNAGRYGDGDVQWMTAGKGIVHGENFPLLFKDKKNPLRFFQIWLNLPAKNKMVDPDFVMHWKEDVKSWENEKKTSKVIIWAGEFNGIKAAGEPPKNSYASQPNSHVGIFHIALGKDESIEFPPCKTPESHRYIYLIEGSNAIVDNELVKLTTQATLIEVDGSQKVKLGAPDSNDVEFLILEGHPIGEPVAQHGPFVMNSQQEIRQAFLDYQKTQFGGWPWENDAQVFPRDKGRFALIDSKEIVPSNNKIL